MIKVAILGGESSLAGELIRILLLHPEVELMAVSSETRSGETVRNIHYGFEGEREIRFCGQPDMKDIDVLFVAEEIDGEQLRSMISNFPEMKIIGFRNIFEGLVNDDHDIAPALSEIYRKNLVRGAKYSYILSPVSSLVLIALFPLAKNLLLNDEMNIEVGCPSKLISDSLIEDDSEVISRILNTIQQSFEEKIKIEYKPIDNNHDLRLKIRLKCNVDLDEVRGLYENVYDDHNFTFLSDREVNFKDVSGNQKCIIHLSKSAKDVLEIEAVADPMMRGGAGDAVHSMNLLLGLYEKIGLSFRAICR